MTDPAEDHAPEIAAHPFLAGAEHVAEAAAAEVPRFLREAETAARGALLGPLASRLFVIVLAVLAIGAAGWWALRPAAPVPEVVKAAPQVRQADGSVMAATEQASTPPPVVHSLPRGAVRERAGRIVAAPASGASSVEIDTDLVRLPDGQRKVIVSSPDGTIDAAVDIPIDPPPVPPPAKVWAGGMSYDTRHAVGVWLDRDLGGRLRVGTSLRRLPDGKAEAEIRVGVRW